MGECSASTFAVLSRMVWWWKGKHSAGRLGIGLGEFSVWRVRMSVGFQRLRDYMSGCITLTLFTARLDHRM